MTRRSLKMNRFDRTVGKRVFSALVDAQIASATTNVKKRSGRTARSRQRVAIAVSADAGEAAELLLLSGKALNEPVACYGPFVMNAREQIQQEFADYQSGRFGVIPTRG